MSQITVVQGEDRPLKIQILEVDDQGVESPVDLSSASEIRACFFNGDGTILELKLSDTRLTLEPGAGGIFTVDWTEAETAALREGPQQSFEVEYVIATKTSIAQFENVLTVKSRICP